MQDGIVEPLLHANPALPQEDELPAADTLPQQEFIFLHFWKEENE
jgi:hypothetical protein